MFTLIKREIEDHLVYLIGAGIVSAILAVLSILIVFEDNSVAPGVFFFPLNLVAIVVMVGLCGMGVSQMYTDRSRRISAFLSTLPVTRDQILIARIITGILVILTFLMPLTITALVLCSLFTSPIPMYPGLIFYLFIVIFLMSFACYCLGLQTGWTSNKVIPTMGGLVLALVLFTLTLVKGFGLHIVIILLLFITASIARTRHRFMSTPL
jgi:ABC-type transport system involved in multi-copper enzyme maturation permease subunit